MTCAGGCSQPTARVQDTHLHRWGRCPSPFLVWSPLYHSPACWAFFLLGPGPGPWFFPVSLPEQRRPVETYRKEFQEQLHLQVSGSPLPCAAQKVKDQLVLENPPTSET